MSDFQPLFADASQLPVGERVQLIDALWKTLTVEAMPALNDEWRTEIERRSAELDAGLVQPIPWQQVARSHCSGRAVPNDSRRLVAKCGPTTTGRSIGLRRELMQLQSVLLMRSTPLWN